MASETDLYYLIQKNHNKKTKLKCCSSTFSFLFIVDRKAHNSSRCVHDFSGNWYLPAVSSRLLNFSDIFIYFLKNRKLKSEIELYSLPKLGL